MAEIYIIMGTYRTYEEDASWITGAFADLAIGEAQLAKLNALNTSANTGIRLDAVVRRFDRHEDSVKFEQGMLELDAGYEGDDHVTATSWKIIATTVTGGPQHG